MKYPCNLIRDLMPLYHDEVASEESILAIREHLDECRECRKYYDNMCESDAVEPISYDEEIEKRAAASYKEVYKKVIKKSCKMVGFIFLTIVGLLLALYIAVIAYLKISAATSWEEHRDINEYGLLDNGKNVLDVFALYESGISGSQLVDRIWPEEIKDGMEVQDYLMIYYCPWDSNYFGYLVVKYKEVDFQAEITRLSEYPSTDYIGRYGAEGFKDYKLLAMQDSSSEFVYALTDGEGTIIYVGMQFPGYSMDIEYEKYVPKEYLPEGLDLSKDNPTRQKAIQR